MRIIITGTKIFKKQIFFFSLKCTVPTTWLQPPVRQRCHFNHHLVFCQEESSIQYVTMHCLPRMRLVTSSMMVADAICPKLLATWTCTHPRGLSRHLRTVFPFHFSCPDIIRNNWILSDAKCSARQILTMPRVASRIRTLKEHSTVFSEQLMQREVAFWSGFEKKIISDPDQGNSFGSNGSGFTMLL